MALKPTLELRQGQTLVMTPQLQQAIRLLQMSNLDLSAYVETELERNPLLESDETVADAPAEPAEAAAAEDVGEGAEALAGGSGETHESGDAGAPYGESGDAGWSSLRPSGQAGGETALEATVSHQITLAEYLSEQLAIAITDPSDRLIGVHLIGMLDDAGYLATDIDTVAQTLGASREAVARVLGIMQQCDPPGVFARTLKECLAIQLLEQDRYDPAMAALVDNLELLARRDFAALRKVCGVDMDDLRAMVAELRRLNPKPGNAYGSVVVHPVVPDVFVRAAPDGSWIVELNSDTLPRVLINNQYYASVSRTAREEDKVYLSECYANANWLVKSLEQRARTILKVAREIVRQQDAFLVHGVEHLRPLNLRTVADAIEMHESTVSRVTANKYVSTPRGIFELKYFFTAAIASAEGGEAHSAEAVRHRIKALVEAEKPGEILSDDRIVELLRGTGIDIARRTVAKYREALGIPSSVQRRREKNI